MVDAPRAHCSTDPWAFPGHYSLDRDLTGVIPERRAWRLSPSGRRSDLSASTPSVLSSFPSRSSKIFGMFQSLDQRKEAYLAGAEDSNMLSLADLMALIPLPSSEDRLLDLPQGAWTPTAFSNAARDLLRQAGLTVSICTTGQTVPPLGPDVRFQYTSEYLSVLEHAIDDLTVVVVVEQNRVIGYGIACLRDTGSHIEIIDVDRFSRRSAGLELRITFGAAVFGVGVAHLVVDSLVSTVSRPCLVDATNTDSRYVFKSLGLIPRGDGNPCLLELR
jgi:hypothetical protein